MTNGGKTDQPPRDVPEVAVKTRRGFSIVWLVPLVAAAIAGWLAYTTLTEKGPEITISFKTAEGLEAGKTKVKYKDVEVGMVDDVVLSDDLSKVIVSASMQKGTGPHLTKATRFWVVRPRLGAGGVSGLGTLVSGAYIEMDPAAGEQATEFVGVEVPPVVQSGVAGTKYRLRADRLGSISRGSPISYRGIDVGEVMGYELAQDSSEVLFHVFVKAPHDKLVNTNTRFWNASGIDVSMGADGVNVEMESLQSLLTGGIAFETPAFAMSNPAAEAGTSFDLYRNRAAIGEAELTEKHPFLLHFEGSVRGLEIGSPVEMRGIRIGSVTDIEIVFDEKSPIPTIPVTIVIEPERISGAGGKRAFKDLYEAARRAVKNGLRAQLKTGSLLTGQLFVDLDYYPNAPPAELVMVGKYPEVPTIPTELAAITKSVNHVLEKIASLPLDQVVADLRNMVRSTERLINSPDVRQTMESLREAAVTSEGAVKQLELTLKQAESTLASADTLIGPKSQLRYDAVEMMKELRGAARSLRVLTDYLERHPEALIQGKSGGSGR
jgi:paraquat-inducible protein B